MVISPPFWSNKRVFLTGHTSFKGNWLSLWLQKLGATIEWFKVHSTGSEMRLVTEKQIDRYQYMDASR